MEVGVESFFLLGLTFVLWFLLELAQEFSFDLLIPWGLSFCLPQLPLQMFQVFRIFQVFQRFPVPVVSQQCYHGYRVRE